MREPRRFDGLPGVRALPREGLVCSEVAVVYQLVCIAGENRGTSWIFEDGELVFGRDAASDIVLEDRGASRRHCRVVHHGQEVHYEDLGSRNLALINGIPLKSAVLTVGDEISIGGERFHLAAVSEVRKARVVSRDGRSTLSWSKGGVVAMKVNDASADAREHPHTVQDLSLLYEAAREFGGAGCVAELFAALEQWLRHRFDPQRLMLALTRGQDEWTVHTGDLEDGEWPPEKTIRQALHQGTVLLTADTVRRAGRKEHALTLVAPVVYGGANLAILALQTETPAGAYDEEDLDLLALLSRMMAPILAAVMNLERLRTDNERLRVRAGESLALLGTSRAMGHVRGQIAKAARSTLSVLITGETGTGKELAGRMLHAESDRHAGPFIVVNCAAIPGELFESHFFGHEKGAYTGAIQAAPGYFEQAHGGALFLDEVGDLSLDNQARILRAIEYGTFRRVGGKDETRVDVRIVAATNKDLPEATRSGAFRQDLYHRLNGIEIAMPPLRKRPSDIPILAEHFLEMAKTEARRPLTGIAEEALDHLKTRPWPGNVRELRNCILRAASMARSSRIQLDDVREPGGEVPGVDEKGHFLSLPEAERRHIEAVLRHCGGNVAEAAASLDIGRSTLYRKMAEYGIK